MTRQPTNESADRSPPAVVLAAFGTAHAEAVADILAVRRRVAAAFPGHELHLAFTSGRIRKIWRHRAADAAYRQSHPEVPAEIYRVRSVLTTLAALQEEGPASVLVQSLHITDGDEYADLARLVAVLAAYETVNPALRPFPRLLLGEPALGTGDGREPYLSRAAAALAPLVARARAAEAALVLVGHGNARLSQRVFSRLEAVLRREYGAGIHIGTVESPPLAADVVEALRQAARPPRRVLLAPLMLVAGDHARHDIAGDSDDSWAAVLTRAGFAVTVHREGLGSLPSWADLYVEHLGRLLPA